MPAFNASIDKATLNTLSFLREALSTFIFFYCAHNLLEKLFFANSILVFGCNIVMRLPFMNTWVLLLVLVSYNHFPEGNSKLFLGESETVSKLHMLWFVVLFCSAEVVGVLCAVIANISGDLYMGKLKSSSQCALGVDSLARAVCPAEIHVPSMLQSVADTLKTCVDGKHAGLDECYSAGSDVYDCVLANRSSLRAMWVFDEAFATLLYLLMVLHVLHMSCEVNVKSEKKSAEPVYNPKKPISKSPAFMKNIWTTGLYVAMCDLFADVAFPQATHNVLVSLYKILEIAVAGEHKSQTVEEHGFRILGGCVGMCFLCLYFYVAYVCETDRFCYLLAWNEVLVDESTKASTITVESVPTKVVNSSSGFGTAFSNVRNDVSAVQNIFRRII